MSADALPVAGRLAAIVGLVLINGFFVTAEFALVGIRRSRVDELAATGSATARLLQRALDRIDVNLAATQLGVTLASLALGWLGEPTLAALVAPMVGDGAASHVVAGGIAFALITTVQIVLGELAPKNLALQRTERAALLIVGPLAAFSWLFRPAIIVLNALGNGVLRLFGLSPDTAERELHSPDELKRLVAESTEGGLIEGAQQEVVERAFDMTALPVRAIMTPRRDIAWIDADRDRAGRVAAIGETRHALVLVGRGGLDRLLGVVRKQDLLDAHLAGSEIEPLDHLRQPVVVPSTATVLHLLELFKDRPVAMAVVVDEHGVVQGLITDANLLRAMAGDLPEDDAPELFRRGDDGAHLIDGAVPMVEVVARLDLPAGLAAGEFRTLAGFCLDRTGDLPDCGAAFEAEGWRFAVTERDHLRIKTVCVSPAGSDEPAGVDEAR